MSMTVTNLEQHAYTLEALRKKKGFICDMDGVISVSYTHLRR